MVRRISLLALTALFEAALVPAPAQADDDAGIHRTGQFRARSYARWALGDSPSPLLASLDGDRGQRVGGAFFIAPPIAANLELVCRVPHGLAIVFSHAGWFTWIPADGSTDAEIIASANANFAPVTTWVRFDGERVGDRRAIPSRIHRSATCSCRSRPRCSASIETSGRSASTCDAGEKTPLVGRLRGGMCGVVDDVADVGRAAGCVG